MQNLAEKLISCPLCSSPETALIFTKDDINYYKCKGCSFRFSKPPVNLNFQDDIESYEEAYINFFDENKSDRLNFNLVWTWISQRIDLSDKKLLDVGCGSGKFVKFLREKNVNAIGLEPSKPLFNRYLKGKDYFYNLALDTFSEMTREKFHMVTLCDVFEHVEDPRQLVDYIAKIQPANGYLIIEIPLFGSLTSLILGKKWHFYNKYHLSYFSKETLFQLLAAKGYNLVFYKYRGKYFQLSYLFNYLFNFVFRKENVKVPPFLEKMSIYLNTYDILFACFKKADFRREGK